VFQSQAKFERVMMPEARGLLRFARRLTGNTSSAEDLVQETLLKAWRGFRQFQDGTNARAWLYRILVNSFYAQGRKLGAATIPLDNGISARPLEIDRLEIAEALDGLPEEHRTVLLLGVVEGFTCREISEILTVPLGTVMSRLSRARHSLRERLAPERAAAAAGHGQKEIR
jgi:RNA polymerase sigma-70 factor (ECF subfamily)